MTLNIRSIILSFILITGSIYAMEQEHRVVESRFYQLLDSLDQRQPELPKLKISYKTAATLQTVAILIGLIGLSLLGDNLYNPFGDLILSYQPIIQLALTYQLRDNIHILAPFFKHPLGKSILGGICIGLYYAITYTDKAIQHAIETQTTFRIHTTDSQTGSAIEFPFAYFPGVENPILILGIIELAGIVHDWVVSGRLEHLASRNQQQSAIELAVV